MNFQRILFFGFYLNLKAINQVHYIKSEKKEKSKVRLKLVGYRKDGVNQGNLIQGDGYACLKNWKKNIVGANGNALKYKKIVLADMGLLKLLYKISLI